MANNTNEEVENLFGVTTEQMEANKEFNLTLKIELNKVYKLKILSEKPRQVTFPVQEKGKEIQKTSPVIEVENLEDKQIYDLWLSASTLSARIAKIYVKNNKSIKGVFVQVTKRQVDHESYGLTNMYSVKEIEVGKDFNTNEEVEIPKEVGTEADVFAEEF